MTARIVRADAIVPGDERPIRDGALVIDERGTIVEVGAAGENAHVHVELSALRGKVSGGHGFVPWVEQMLGLRASEHPEEESASIERATEELDRFGTTAVGEVTNTLSAVHSLARHGIGGMIFHELFGLQSDRALARLSAMQADTAAREQTWPSADLAYSESPHTVYTTHPDAIRALLSAVRARGTRTTVHLAEHPAERTFLLHGTGAFLSFAARLGLPIERFPIPRKGPVEVAQDLGLLAPDVLLVHLTDVRAAELELVVDSGASVVLCPRSNLFIEVKLPPLVEMLSAGLIPALGTDSLASNLSLDVLAEARALADRFPSVSKQRLIEMATTAGARALGRPDLGRLAKGCRPGVLAVVGTLGASEDPCAWVLRQPASARKWIARRGRDHQPKGASA